jgi:hypothetical protein
MKYLNSLLIALTAACASAPQHVPVAAGAGTTSTTNAEVGAAADRADRAECALACESATVTSPGVVAGEHHAAAVANVDAVVASMHDDLLACYRARVATYPSAHASVTLSVLINPDGSVRSVTSTGGAMLGDAGLRCITRRVERAVFAPVHGGGTLRTEIPLLFRRLPSEESL